MAGLVSLSLFVIVQANDTRISHKLSFDYDIMKSVYKVKTTSNTNDKKHVHDE